jgi:hypothetical protein
MMRGMRAPTGRIVATRLAGALAIRFASAVAFAGALLFPVPGAAWHTSGHARVASEAVAALGDDVPEFFRAGADAVGQAAIDPDVMKERATPHLRVFEYPEHYLDYELLDGAPLPEDRYALVALLHERRLAPRQVGFLPYTVTEGVQRLTMAFAEHRRWPADTRIQQRILVYAGLLSHYAADLQQPLHTSLHHDGRALPDGSSPHTGIHTLVDALFDTVPLDMTALARELPVRDLGDPWTATLAAFAASHALVDEVYRLEEPMRASAAAGSPTAAVAAFAAERFRATANFLASLYTTAWQRSAEITFPAWHDRQPSLAPPQPQTPSAPATAPASEPATTDPEPGAEIILRPRPS